MRLNVRRKLMLILVGTSSVALALAGGAMITYGGMHEREAMRQDLVSLADIAGANSTAAMVFGDVNASREILATLSAKPAVVAAALYDAEGRLFAAFRRADSGGEPLPKVARAEVTRFTSDRCIVVRAVRLTGDVAGFMYVASDLSEVRQRRGTYAALLGAIILGTLVVVYLISLRLQGVISRPIVALARVTREVSESKNYALRAVHGGRHDEIGALVTGFNGMLAQIQEHESRLRTHREDLEREVTERTSELVAAKERAEVASMAKSEFMANMSHELRTPLNSVIGFSDILLKNKAQTFGPKDLGYLDRIQANGRHLLALINSVLDLSKVEAGHMELEITSVPLAALARETLAELESQAQLRNLRLIGEYPDSPCVMETDRAKLKQVLINLVANALKFSGDGDAGVRVVLVADPHTGRPIRIDVVDQGIGIPAERLQSIFEAFQQADNSTSRRFGGTGLGLTISRSLCRLMGFDLVVTSEAGVGSTFSVVFTREVAVATVPAGPTAPGLVQGGDAAGDGFLVLVIDDESDARVILRRSFEDFGCTVMTAASVDEGIALARTVSPQLITVDLLMPAKSGWDALRELEADPQLRGIPIVVVSAVASENRMQLFGALEYLNKPVTHEELARVVRRSGHVVPSGGKRIA